MSDARFGTTAEHDPLDDEHEQLSAAAWGDVMRGHLRQFESQFAATAPRTFDEWMSLFKMWASW